MPLFSVIIPVYNVEPYLRKCIESVLNQKYENFEVLLIDDGSSDGCPAICDEYAIRDSRIKVLHKENGGLSSARNAGLSLAKGEYILFLDSDDYWEGERFLNQLSDKIKTGCDVCFYGCYDEFADTGRRIKSRGNYNETIFSSGKKDEILYSLFIENQFPGSCWILCVKKNLLEQYKIKFIEGIKSEDIDWLLNVLSYAQSFECLNMCGYIYLKNRPNSITKTAGLHSIYSILITVKKWGLKIKKEQTEKSYLVLNSYLMFVFLTSVIVYNNLTDNEKRNAKVMYEDIALDYNNILGQKLILSSQLYRIFGLEVTSKILNFIRIIKRRGK